MARVSELTRLYEAVYGKPPSNQTAAALSRMETVFGLAQDDPVARLLIVQLYVADDTRAAGAELRVLAKELVKVVPKVKALTMQVDHARDREIDRSISRPSRGRGASRAQIDTYNPSLPIWRYLGEAFRRKRGVLDEDERIGAARFDLATLLALAGIIGMTSFGYGRWLA